MYIRIEFENLDSIETRKTKQKFGTAPNGLCLTSTNSHFIYVDEALKPRCKAIFWYLDIAIVNKYYGGIMVALNSLLEHQGVRRVDVLPIEGPYCENSHNFTEKFAQFIDGVD
jgi:hypothetical protein